MRTLTLLAILTASVSARADGFAELAAGVAIPAGNSDWTNTVDPSPKLAARVGAMSSALSGELGGMLGLDWTPESLDGGSGGSFGIGSTNNALHRFRAIASAVIHHRIAPKIWISGRAGAGIDIAHASLELTILGSTSSSSDTDVGYAFEFGAGVWFEVGSTQLGIELALPIGHHDKQAMQNGDIPFRYTDIDVDLMFSVRL